MIFYVKTFYKSWLKTPFSKLLLKSEAFWKFKLLEFYKN